MTEHDPQQVHFVYSDPQFESRRKAATALRELGNAFVGHRTDDETLAAITRWAKEATQSLRSSAPVKRPTDYFEKRYTDPIPLDGQEVIAFSDRTFSGPANPMGMEIRLTRRDKSVVASANFGSSFESAPGRVHGGAISAVVDDVMGYLMIVLGEAAYTAKLEVDYLGGVPVGETVWFHARESSRVGRKLSVELTVSLGPIDDFEATDPVIVARGLFIIARK